MAKVKRAIHIWVRKGHKNLPSFRVWVCFEYSFLFPFLYPLLTIDLLFRIQYFLPPSEPDICNAVSGILNHSTPNVVFNTSTTFFFIRSEVCDASPPPCPSLFVPPPEPDIDFDTSFTTSEALIPLFIASVPATTTNLPFPSLIT